MPNTAERGAWTCEHLFKALADINRCLTEIVEAERSLPGQSVEARELRAAIEALRFKRLEIQIDIRRHEA